MNPGGTTILVPLYADPGPQWEALVAACAARPHASVCAIVNPNSGPDVARRTEYVRGIASLRAAGITVAGYLATGYGARADALVNAEIAAWRAWYGVDAIFFDEVASGETAVPWYAAHVATARASGVPFAIGNPGTTVHPAFAGVFDVCVICENIGYPSAVALAASPSFARSSIGAIARNVPYDFAELRATAAYVGMLYATDSLGEQEYDRLPTYFADLLLLDEQLAGGMAQKAEVTGGYGREGAVL